jgi:hypothetical protein
MAASDLDQLVMMGFGKERSEMAIKETGGCEWIVAPSTMTGV